MATTFPSAHPHHLTRNLQSETPTKNAKRSEVATFVSDLIEDVAQKPLQPAALAKHDMFREHINAMSISYFALIVVLIAASLPVLAYVINF
jgi:hypothetical protein